MTDRNGQQPEIEYDYEDDAEIDAAPAKKGMLTSLKEGFNAKVLKPINNFVIVPLKCVFDIAAMPVRDAFVYPNQTVRAASHSMAQKALTGAKEFAVNAGIGGGAAFAAGFFLPVIPVSTPLIIASALYGKPVVARLINKYQLKDASRSTRERKGIDKTLFFPSLKK